MSEAVAAASEAGTRCGNATVMAISESGCVYTAWAYGKGAAARVLEV
jgi:hypothetical protein